MDLFGNTHSHSLYIIGNGFDLAHGMKTSWQDFYDWLKSNGYNPLITFCENNFSLETDLWQDFEKALGEYDLNSIFDYCTEDIEIVPTLSLCPTRMTSSNVLWIGLPI